MKRMSKLNILKVICFISLLVFISGVSAAEADSNDTVALEVTNEEIISQEPLNTLNDPIANDQSAISVNMEVYNTTLGDKSNVNIGENVTYSINVSLENGTVYNNVSIKNVLPDGFVYGGAVYGNGTSITPHVDGQIVTFEFLNVDYEKYGENIVVFLNATVANTPENIRGSKSNYLSLFSNGNLIDEVNSDVNIVEPNFDIGMSFDKDIVQGGENVSLLIDIINNGDANIYNVTINNLTSLFSEYVNMSTLSIIGVDVITNLSSICVGTIEPNTDKQIIINFNVTNNVIIGSSYTGNVNIAGNSLPYMSSQTRRYDYNDTVSFTTMLPSMDKTVANDKVAIGDNVVYIINVTLPNGKYNNITISDVLPDDLTYVNTTVAGNIITPTIDGNTLTFTFIDIDADDYDGNLVLYVTCVVDDVNANVAGVTKTNVATLVSNNTFINEDAVDVTIVEPVLDVVIGFNDTDVQGGTNVTLIIDVSNNGNGNACNVSVNYNLSDLINNYIKDKYLANVIVTIDGIKYTVEDLDAAINLGTISPNTTKHVQINFVVKDDVMIGSSYNTGDITIIGYSTPTITNNTRNYTKKDSAGFATDLPTMEKVVYNNNVAIGEIVNYYINIILPKGNYSNITVIDELPKGILFKDAKINGVPAQFSTSLDDSKITFEFINFSSYDYNNRMVIDVRTMVENINSNVDGVILTNNATLISNNTVINKDNVNVTIIEPNITLEKTALVKEGQVNRATVFEFKVTNNGDALAKGVYIYDDLTGLINEDDIKNVIIKCDGLPAEYRNKGKQFKIIIGDLAPGETKVIYFLFYVDKNAEILKNLTNTAFAYGFSSDDEDHARIYNDTASDTFIINITSFPNVIVTEYNGKYKSETPLTPEDPLEVIVGGKFTYALEFNNTGVISGYNTVVDLIVSGSVDNFTATYLGHKVAIVKGTNLGNGTWYDPINKAYVDVPEGNTLFILEIPVGGFTPEQPPAEVVISGVLDKKHNNTDLINITAIPFFQYGNDYTGYENAIRGNESTGYIKPKFVHVDKSSELGASSGKVATGYTWRFEFSVSVDLVNDLEYTLLELIDNLPSNLKYIPGTLVLTDSRGQEVPQELYDVSYPDDMGGKIEIKFKNPVVGGPSTVDYKFTYMVYAPKYDNTTDDLKEIINNLTGARNLTRNEAVVTYSIGEYGFEDSVSDDFNVSLQSIKIVKGVTDLNGTNNGYTGPGHKLSYTIHYEISDYFTFTEFVLNDTVGGKLGFDQTFTGEDLVLYYNGQTYVMNKSYYTITNLTNGKWRIMVYVSQFFNDTFGSDVILNGTSGSIKFNVTVNSINHEGTVINSMDRLSNSVTGTVKLESGNYVSDSDGAGIVIDAPEADSKSISHINGVEQGKEYYYDIYAQDNVTFLIEIHVPNSVDKLEIKDYVTIPIFSINGFDVNPSTPGIIPEAGHWAFADETSKLYDIDGNEVLPVVTLDSNTRSISFVYNKVYKPVQNVTTLRIYITLQVGTQYLADQLFKPNLISIYYNDIEQNNYDSEKVVWMLLNEPNMNIDKNVNDTIVQNGDVVEYNVTISNDGHTPAYDVIVADDLLDKYGEWIKDGTVTNFRAVYGNGTVIDITMDYFNSTKGFDFGTLNQGENITIFYTVTFNSHAVPASVIVNTADVLRYSSVEGGYNFILDKPLFSNATLETYGLEFSKDFMGSNDFNKSELYIGESGVFNLTVWLPQLDVVNLTFEDLAPNLGFYRFEVIYGDGVLHDGVDVVSYVFSVSKATPRAEAIATEPYVEKKYYDLVHIGFNGTLLATNNVTNYVTILMYYVANQTFFNYDYVFDDVNNAKVYYNCSLDYASKKEFIYNILENEMIHTTYLSDRADYTIVQSVPKLESKVNVTSVQGGDVVKITYDGKTNGYGVLFNTTISTDLADLINNFIIDQDVANINITVVSGNETGKAKVYWNNSVLCIDFGEVEETKDLIVELTFVVKPDVVLGTNYTNTAYIDAGSMPDNRYNETRYYSDNDSLAFSTLTYFDANKVVTNTSEGNDTEFVSYGEIIDYAIVIDVPKGFVNITINDILPNGFELIEGSLVLSDGTVLTRDNYTLNGRQLNIVLDVVVIDQPLVVNYKCIVVNDVAKNPVGQLKTNVATVTWFDKVTSKANVTIVSPNAYVTKIYNVTTVEGLDGVELVISATNTGNSVLYNATIIDDLTDLITKFVNKDDLNITIVEGNETGKLVSSWNGNVIKFYMDELDAAKSIVIKFTFNVKADVKIGVTHDNKVDFYGYSVSDDTKYVKNFTDDDIDRFNTVGLHIDKNINNTSIINDKTHVTIGEEIVYVIDVDLATGSYDRLEIKDALPAGFDYILNSVKVFKDGTVSETTGYTIDYTNRVVTISFNNDFAQDVIYNYDKKFRVYLTAIVLNNTQNKASIVPKVNTATYYWNNKQLSDSASVTVVEPQVAIDKVVNNTIVKGGDNVYYDIVVENTGNSILYNASVVDDLTKFIGVFVGDASDIQILVDGVETAGQWNGSVLTINLGDLNPGVSKNIRLVFTVKNDISIGSVFNNIATIKGYSIPIINGEERAYVGTDNADIRTEDPSIDKVVDGTNVTNSKLYVTIGDKVYYLITVNLPEGNYTVLNIIDTLPTGFEFVSAVDKFGAVENISVVDNKVLINYTNIDSYTYDGKLVINLTVLVKDIASNKAGVVRQNNIELEYEGSHDYDRADITIVEPKITVTKTVNVTVIEGGDGVYYEITVKNTGNSVLYNASILDDLTKLVNEFALNGKQGITAKLNNNPVAIDWIDNAAKINLGDMNPNEVKVIRFTFTVRDDVVIGNTFKNTVLVNGYSVPYASNDTRSYIKTAESKIITTQGPSIIKNVNNTNVTQGLDTVTIGEGIDYLITLDLPTGNYTYIQIEDDLPEGLAFVSAHYLNGTEVPVTVIGQKIIIRYDNVHSSDFNGLLVINITALVKDENVNKAGDLKVNSVTFDVNGAFEGNDEVTVTVIEPDLEITKTADNSKYNVTEKVEYTITIENIGTSTAYTINLADVLDKGLIFTNEYETNLPWNVNFDSATNTLTVSGSELEAGSKFTLVFNCTFDQDLADILGKDIYNTAEVNYSSVNDENNRSYTNSSTNMVHVVVCDLSVEKIATSDIYAGKQVTYLITVENNGPDVAYDVILKDIFDGKYLSNVQYSLDGTRWNNYGQSISLGSINANSKKLVYIRALLNAGALGILNNTAVVSTSVNESRYDNNVDENITTIISNTELNVNKVDNITTGVIAGENIEYTITVENKGPAVAFNSTLTDYYDVTQLLNVEYSTDKVVWMPYTNATVINLGDVAPNEKRTFYFRALVNASSRGIIVNVANITTDTKNTGINSSTEITPIITDCGFIIEKVANVTSVIAGDSIQYVITVTATGHSNSFNVTLTDILDATLLDVTNAQYTLDGVSKGSWTGSVYYGTMHPGDSFTITITGLKVKESADKDIFNEANVTSVEVPEGVVDNVTVHLTSVDLAVTKTTNATNGLANLFDEITYYITVTNKGIDTSNNVTAFDLIDQGVIIKDIKSTSGTVYDQNTGIWTIGSLAPGETVTLNITCKINAFGVIPNHVSVNGTGHDTNLTNNNASVNVSVAEYTIDKTSVDVSYINNTITYTIAVTNTNNIDGINVKVIDVWQDGKFEFVSASGNGVHTDNKCVWTIPQIAKGTTEYVTITLKVLKNGTLVNNATVNNVTTNKTIIVPEVTVDKTVNVVNPNYGDLVEFYITVYNKFNVTVSNVTVWDVLPQGLEFVSADYGGVNSSLHDVKWNFDLGANSEIVLTVVAKVVDYGNLTNVAIVNDNNGKGDNKTDNSSVLVPEYSIVKDTQSTIVKYNNITYTITVTNTNNIDGYDIVVVDTWIKEQLGGSGNYTWTIDHIGAGESVVLNITLTALTNGTITNTATVNNVTTNKIIIVPEVTVDKTVNVVNPNYGDLVEFYITVYNGFDAIAYNVTVWDVLPAGLEFVSADYGGVNSSLHDVKWNFDLGANSEIVLTVVAKVVDYGNLTNVAIVNDNNGKGDNKTDNSSVFVPEYTIIKVADDIYKVYSVGEEVTYTIVIANTNDIKGNNVVVMDKFDERLQFISSTGPNEDLSHLGENKIYWTFDEIDEGATVEFNVTFKVIGANTIPNTVFVNNVSDTENITIVNLTVNKTTVDEIINYDGMVEFILNVTNPTDGIARNVTITDVLGNGLEFLDSNFTANMTVVDKQKVYWIVNVPAEGLVIKVRATVKDYGVLNNTVYVDDHNGVKNSTSFVKVAKYDIDKEANIDDKKYSLGELVVYEIIVSNDNNIEGKNIEVVDIFNNAQLVFVNSTGPNEDASGKDNGIIKWTIPSMAAGEVYKFKVTFVVMAPETTVISNNVKVNNVTSTENITVVGVTVDKIANVTTPNYGELVSFDIVIGNEYNTEIRNVTVMDILSPGLEFVSTNYTVGFNNATKSWSNLTIGPDGLTINVICKVTKYGDLNNTVSVNDNNGVSDNKTDIAEVYVPEITVNKDAINKTYIIGDEITYTITVIGDNNTDANKVLVTDYLPAELINIETDGVYDKDKHIITWIIDIPAGESINLTVKGKLNGSGLIDNKVTVGNHTANKTIFVEDLCDVEITIDAPKEPVKVGEPFEVIVTVTNHGPSTAKDVVATLDIKGSYILQKYDPSKGVFTNVWTIGDLACNETVVLRLTLIATAPGEITISANVTTTTNESDYTNNNASAAVVAIQSNNNDTPYNPHNVANKGAMYATGNPLLALLVVLLCIPVLRRKE